MAVQTSTVSGAMMGEVALLIIQLAFANYNFLKEFWMGKVVNGLSVVAWPSH